MPRCCLPLKPPVLSHQPTRLRAGQGGFTLLEVVLAAAILVIISVSVFQFTSVTIRTTDVSLQESQGAMACGGFRRLLETQLASLPAKGSGTLIGVVVDGKKGAGRRDALQLVCPAGNALLTPDAKGLYEITLTLREIPRGSGRFSLGMERTPWDDDDDDDDDDDTSDRPKASSTKADAAKIRQALPSDWVTLMDGVNDLEFAYFDARLNGWVDKWTDSANLPSLVRVRLAVGAGRSPYEFVERVPGGAANAKVIPTTATAPGSPGTGQTGTVQRPPATNANNAAGE